MNIKRVNKLRYIFQTIHWILFSAIALAMLTGLLHAFSNQSRPRDRKAYGFDGSVKGRVFLARSAAEFFPVSVTGKLRINIDNFSKKSYRLKIFSSIQKHNRRIIIHRGTTKLIFHDHHGPIYLQFDWDQWPEGVVLTVLNSSEFLFFSNLVTGATLLAALSILLAVFLFRRQGIPVYRQITPLVFGVFFFGVYFYVQRNAPIPLTGDEPHYMIIADSMVSDFDLRVKNNYNSSRREFYYPGPLDQHVFPQNPELPSHYPLLPLLISPAFIGAKTGLQIDSYTVSKIILLLIAAALMSFLCWRVAKDFNSNSALAFAMLLALGLPFLAYTNQLYPEPLAGAIIFIVTYSFYKNEKSPRNHLLTALLIVLLPFANLKFALAALVLGIYLLLIVRPVFRALLRTMAVLLAGAIAIFIFTVCMYGSLKGPYSNQEIVFDSLFRRYLAYLFDADMGLFALTPLLMWSIPGFFVLLRSDRRFAIYTVIIILVGHLPNMLQRDELNWLLGNCPSGRYWLAVYPVIAWLAVDGFHNFYRTVKEAYLRIPAALFSVVFFMIGAVQILAFLDFQEGYYLPIQKPFNAAALLLKYTGMDLTFLFGRYPFTAALPVAVWIILAMIFLIFGLKIMRSDAVAEKS